MALALQCDDRLSKCVEGDVGDLKSDHSKSGIFEGRILNGPDHLKTKRDCGLSLLFLVSLFILENSLG